METIMELGKARSTEEIIKDIKATLESKVKDNVATHGGEINFLSSEKGIVRLQMAGACLELLSSQLFKQYMKIKYRPFNNKF